MPSRERFTVSLLTCPASFPPRGSSIPAFVPFSPSVSPLALPNIRRFIAFRVLFNARLYYPVLAILFLDFGLTPEQYALLNAIWAAAIVLLEVPSGALADIFGRTTLLRFASVCMVVEMALLAFLPAGQPGLAFALLALNRILSGAAEAAASGADEALAFDSLKEAGIDNGWPRVLEALMRIQSVAFMAALLLGGFLYDSQAIAAAAGFIGLDFAPPQSLTMRFPAMAVFLQSLVLTVVVFGFREVSPEGGGVTPAPSGSPANPAVPPARVTPLAAFRATLEAGGWILATPFALIVILYGFLFDSIVRIFLTFQSQYLRLLGLPEVSYGAIGAAFGLIGLLISPWARRLAEKGRPSVNLLTVSLLTLLGLVGLNFHHPLFGLLPIIPLLVSFNLVTFLVSHYLNQSAPSRRRATILSFRGLSFNLAYGALGLLFASLLTALRPSLTAAHPDLSPAALQDTVFAASLPYFPPWFLGALLLATLFSWVHLRRQAS